MPNRGNQYIKRGSYTSGLSAVKFFSYRFKFRPITRNRSNRREKAKNSVYNGEMLHYR